MQNKLNYQYCCVSPISLEELIYIIDNAREITWNTFIKYVDKKQIQHNDSCIPLKNDWSVSFYKSKLPNGKPVYYYRHSSIEYIYY